MTTVYLIRHTQAEGNLYRAMQGQWDGNITDMGLKQIENLQNRMKNEHIDKVYSSDLYRAYITAKVGVADDRGIDVITDKRLREIDMGPWERKFFGNVINDHPKEAQTFMFDSENFYWPGAERFDDVRRRMYECIEELAVKNDGMSIAVCSHGVSLRCFLSKVCNVNLSDVYTVPICKNTAITRLEYEDGKFNIIYKNDFSHLGKYDPPKWNSTADIRDVILNLNDKEDADYYINCYEEGWKFAHGGSTENFQPELYLMRAMQHAQDYHASVLRLKDKDVDAGLVDLDTVRGEDENYGWISLLYLNPEYRGKGYGIQALARAILLYTELGRKSIRLMVNNANTIALKFYEKNGFRSVQNNGDTIIMERELGNKLK